jgi:23S rRNA (pseudouridine1915-N3)-methyltransferase
MKLVVAAVGHRMPAWVDAGFDDYARRMPRDARLELIAIKPEGRGASRPTERLLDAEGKRLLASLPRQCVKVVLDERGTLLATAQLARRIERWRADGGDVAFLVGGADGLAEGLKRGADFTWSLTPLTLPHGLARVVLAEQLYRAVSILHNHPYHRE